MKKKIRDVDLVVLSDTHLGTIGARAKELYLYLKKKLLVIPMHNQYEQLCNAHALEQLGVPVLSALNQSAIDVIKKWMQSENKVNLDYSEDPHNLIP